VKGSTPKAVEIFRHTTKTGNFAHHLPNQVWAGFWSHDGHYFQLADRPFTPSVETNLGPALATVTSGLRLWKREGCNGSSQLALFA
jgi:hypothetical protein